jgi:C4-dicarboxylate-specific signal transduction histidine kinase
MDVVENSLRAGASAVRVLVVEDRPRDRLVLEVEDNGPGMDPETAAHALDAFYTTKPGKAFGLGLSMLAQSVREAEGSVQIGPADAGGLRVRAEFRLSHPDCRPLGDVAGTVRMLQSAHPDVEFSYRHAVGPEETR